VKVLLEGEEEIGSPRMPDFVKDYRSELQANLVIISDGPVHESGRSVISFGNRGVLDIELRARGANQDLHSGNWGWHRPQSYLDTVHLLGTMKNAQGEITIDGFYDNVQPLNDLERAALAALPLDIEKAKQTLDLTHLDEPQDRGYFERLTAWPTLTINGLHGGYGGPGSKTVLPHEVVAKCRHPLSGRPDRGRDPGQSTGARPEVRARGQRSQSRLYGSLKNNRLTRPFVAPLRAAHHCRPGH